MTGNNRRGEIVLGSFIDALSWDEVISRISLWSRSKQSKCVVLCNVHSVVTGLQNLQHNKSLNTADMVVSDGAPIAWMLRRLGYPNQMRINGPDLMFKYLTMAESRNESIFLYGGTVEALDSLQNRLKIVFPNLNIAGAYSPPFQELSIEDDDAIVHSINNSGAGTVWVSLGCPKQELWMTQHRGRINAVMIGVGAAFDYHANILARAPLWMQDFGLEWLYRLKAEPRRLWKRYLVTNTLFVSRASIQLVKQIFFSKRVK
jgi:N-acetylglucosaminyldiphosphoundecaprenol N-acetyl-beta-D-mannosaminyltransferase